MSPQSLSRRELLLGAAAAVVTVPGWALARDAEHAVDAAGALRRAAEYLWSQQADDGGWHSPQYGLMRSGQALTPFVLHALLTVGESVAAPPAKGVDRALAFIHDRLDPSGALGHADPDFAEYPVYSTAYGVMCAMAVEPERRDMAMLGKMAQYLAGAQFQESNGFDPDSPAYGGWGVDAPRTPGVSGHMDLAHTRRALAAVAAYREWMDAPDCRVVRWPALDRAGKFLAVVQKRADSPDGGFYFSPVVEDANKAGKTADGAQWASYATATCDGVLALLAAGVPRDDERVAGAAAWLAAHDDVDYPQGVLKDPSRPWGEAIRFYHYAVRAEAYRALAFPAKERARLAAAVAKRQRPDGGFMNTVSTLMKEDCPIMCTGLAVTALANSLAM